MSTAEPDQKPDPQRKATIIAVRVCIFFAICSITIPISSIAAFNAKLGGTATSLGSARTLAQMVGLLTGLWMATIIDTIGTKTTLIAICAVAGIAMVVCSMSTSKIMLYVGIILGAQRIHTYTVGKTIISQICTSDELPAQFGFIGMISGLSFVAGPIISIILSKTIGYVFLAGVVSSTIAFFIAISLTGSASDVVSDDTTAETRSEKSIAELLPHLVVFTACTCPLAALLQGLDIYLVSRFKLAPEGIAGVTLVVAVSFAISQGAIFQKLHTRLGSTRLLLSSGVAVAIPLLAVDFVESVPALATTLMFSVVAMGCCKSTVDVMMVELTAPNKSRGNSLASTIGSINTAIMPFAAGCILDAGLPLFIICSCICAAGAGFGFLVLPLDPQKAKPE